LGFVLWVMDVRDPLSIFADDSNVASASGKVTVRSAVWLKSKVVDVLVVAESVSKVTVLVSSALDGAIVDVFRLDTVNVDILYLIQC